MVAWCAQMFQPPGLACGGWGRVHKYKMSWMVLGPKLLLSKLRITCQPPHMAWRVALQQRCSASSEQPVHLLPVS